MAKLSQVLRGIQASQPGQVRFVRLPITPAILIRINESWDAEGANSDRVMLWAAMLLCFFGFFCSEEICSPPLELFDSSAHLSFADVSVDSITNPQQLSIQLKRSKTDPFGKGVQVCVGKTGDQLCPVAAVLAWLVRRGSTEGPLFSFMDGSALTQQRFVTELRKALRTIGEDPSKYGGHSFRSGAATTAAQQGIGDATIKLLGRWRSSASQVYIKTPPSSLAGYSKTLTQSVPGVSRANHSDLP